MDQDINYNREARVKRNANTRFLLVVFGERKWLSFNDCHKAHYWKAISDLGAPGTALDVAGSGVERNFTRQEKNDIFNAANAYYGNDELNRHYGMDGKLRRRYE